MSNKMYINLDNIESNIKEIKKITKNTNIIVMVKSNAYGLGLIPIANFLKELGITFFGVAKVSEGIKLRNSIKDCQILVTSQFLEQDIQDIIDFDLTVSVSNIELLKDLNKQATLNDKLVKIHIEVDTGMTRLGFDLDNVIDNILYIKNNLNNIVLEGIYTHLSSADTDEEYSLNQLNKFDALINELKEKITFKFIHALNSSGLLKYPQYMYNTIRIGHIIYGYYPNKDLKKYISLKPSIKLVSPIIHIRNIQPNTSISYYRTFTSSKNMKIATLQIGYANGLDRKLANKFDVYINDKPCRIVGNICMDMCMIDITNIQDVRIGDYSVVIDYDYSIYNITSILDTTNYEVITRLSDNIERIYI